MLLRQKADGLCAGIGAPGQSRFKRSKQPRDPIAEYRAGNEKAINALKGPIMKRTQGKANPVLIDQLLRKFLG